MKKIYFILIAVIIITSATVFISCRNDATDIIPNDTTPEELPPDPGEEGKKTLEGVDSDNDGVRDDIQRHIALEETDEDVQKILTEYAKNTQKYMLPAEELEAMKDEIIADAKNDLTIKCLYRLDAENAYEIIMGISSVIINTRERLLAENKRDSLLSGQTFGASEEEVSMACEKYLND